jgi:4-hydroxythreonine-4-phosphate dehydrogenase
MINLSLSPQSPLGRPRLAVTLGDPVGIGPEVILRALADPSTSQDCDITVIGSRALLTEIHHHLYQKLKSSLHPDTWLASLANPEQLSILDMDLGCNFLEVVGVCNAVSGAASFAYLDTAIAQTLAGKFDGIVTGPIAKSAWKAAGHHYAGQTELLAERAGVRRFGMLFVARSPYTSWILRTLLATTHIPLRQVADTLTPELLSTKLDLLLECLYQDFGLETPQVAIAGLNPHSGEQGQLGHEEKDWLIPWLEQEQAKRPHTRIEGPIPPDTLWVKPGQAWYGLNRDRTQHLEARQTHDAYLALYHDQGLIPVKLMAFDQAVNTTIGLPFVRTSPDHGTAFDIAGQGMANATSMKAAIQLAATLAQQRFAYRTLTGKV